MELKMLEMKNIVTNPLQPRQEFDREKLQELANSIKEGELLQPIVVRSTDSGNYEIVAGERRFKAFQILKEPKIPSIILNIKDDTDALEKGLIENWQRDDLKDSERRKAINDLWNSGRYTSLNELARKTGISRPSIQEYVDDFEYRQRVATPDNISHTAVRATKGLSDDVRKKAIEITQKKQIPARKLEEEIVPKIKEFSEPEQQIEILEEFEEQEEQSKEIFDGIVEKQRKIARREIEPEHFKENNADIIRLESVKDVWSRASSITSFYINKIESDKQKNEAIQYIQKTIIHLNKVLIALGEVKVIDVEK